MIGNVHPYSLHGVYIDLFKEVYWKWILTRLQSHIVYDTQLKLSAL